MDPEKAAEKIRDGLRSKSLVILVGLMEVFYEGRAASSLGEGERLLIVKQDGSMLVHRPMGYEPVNWQEDKVDYKKTRFSRQKRGLSPKTSL